MLIQLSNQDVHHCTVLGYDTVKLCEMQGFPPRLENKSQSREEANVFGFKAEFAIARLFDLDLPELNVTSDYGVDLWWDDYSIDVKFSNKQDGDLIFDTMDKFKAQIAILVTRTDNQNVMNVVGWMTRKEFERKCQSHNFGYGERLVVGNTKLNPIEELWLKMKELKYKPK
jgi:hypothetical protein